MVTKIYFILLVLFFHSCSLFKSSEDINRVPSDFVALGSSDYLQYLEYLGNQFKLKNKDVKLSHQSNQYLTKVVDKIIVNNENFYRNKKNFNVIFVNSLEPFHFSLPPNLIVLSSELIQRYIEHESFFICVLIFEMIRLERNLFQKSILSPHVNLTNNDLLKILRIPLEVKIESNKWAYYQMTKSHFDQDQYLSWLQVINRNHLDFYAMLGDTSLIFKEESAFKEFIAINYEKNRGVRAQSNSSKDFYVFIKELKQKLMKASLN